MLNPALKQLAYCLILVFLLSSLKQVKNQQCSNSVLGTTGTCWSANPSYLNNYIPSQIKPSWNAISPVFSVIAGMAIPTICYGDFYGRELEEKEELDTAQCGSIPAMDDGKYAFLGMNIPQFPCGQIVEAAMCISFDSCGSVAISINGGVLTCLAYYGGLTTGIVSGLATILGGQVADVFSNISIGVSLQRRFSKDISIIWGEGNRIKVGEVTVQGHIFFDVGISFPTMFQVSAFGKDLSQYFNISGSINAMIDFGSFLNNVSSTLTNIHNMDGNNIKTNLLNFLKLGAEMSLTLNGKFTIGIEDLTFGLVPDIAFSAFDTQLLYTTGNGSSKRSPGIYFRTKTNIVKDIYNSLDGFLKNFADVLNSIGLIDLLASIADIEFGFFFTNINLGFRFNQYGLSVECLFRYSDTRLSCRVNSKWFTVIKEALEWVFKEATDFFVDTGRYLFRKTQQAVREATRAISNSIKASIGFVKNGLGTAISIVGDAFEDLYFKAVEGIKWLENRFEEAAEIAQKIAENAWKAIEKAAKRVACELKKIFTFRWKRSCKKKVENKYRYDSTNKSKVYTSYEWESSNASSDMGGDIAALIGKGASCPYGGVRNFKYVRSDGTVRYLYKCVEAISFNLNSCEFYAAYNISMNYANWLVYDGLEYVNCPSNYFLKGYTFGLNTGLNMFYSYRCCQVSYDYCKIITTPVIQIDSINGWALDRFLVDSLPYHVIKSFNFKRVSKSEFVYEVEACKPTGFSLEKRETYPISDGSGSIWTLTQHKVDCGPGAALNLIKYDLPAAGLSRYNYKCSSSPRILTSCANYFTNFNPIGSNERESVHFLDNHNVTCQASGSLPSVLTKFTTLRSGNLIRYQYTCCGITGGLGNISTLYTTWSKRGSATVNNLSAHLMDARTNGLIRSFQLQINTANEIRYKYEIATLG